MIKSTRIFLLSLAILASSSLQAVTLLEKLSQPGPAAIYAFTFGMVANLGNALWSGRWNKHWHVSDETSARMNEAGGWISTAGGFMLTIVPYLVYRCHARHQAAANAPENS